MHARAGRRLLLFGRGLNSYPCVDEEGVYGDESFCDFLITDDVLYSRQEVVRDISGSLGCRRASLLNLVAVWNMWPAANTDLNKQA